MTKGLDAPYRLGASSLPRLGGPVLQLHRGTPRGNTLAPLNFRSDDEGRAPVENRNVKLGEEQ